MAKKNNSSKAPVSSGVEVTPPTPTLAEGEQEVDADEVAADVVEGGNESAESANEAGAGDADADGAEVTPPNPPLAGGEQEVEAAEAEEEVEEELSDEEKEDLDRKAKLAEKLKAERAAWKKELEKLNTPPSSDLESEGDNPPAPLRNGGEDVDADDELSDEEQEAIKADLDRKEKLAAKLKAERELRIADQRKRIAKAAAEMQADRRN